MSADVELLPLPGKSEIDRHLPTGVRVYGYTADDMKTYARANVAHATAARDAETEGLRAEVAEWKRVAAAQAELHGEAEARAERLAEALRGMMAEYEALHAKHDLGECQATVDARDALRDHDQEGKDG